MLLHFLSSICKSVMWQPSASNAVLARRAEIFRTLREFFYQRNVMEVETPCLSAATVTDQYLASFATEFVGPGFASGIPLYLQTSPEYAMKRLLAAGSGCIYQIGKAFRNEEAGRHHNPEFTMLEWYRVGFDHHDLMAEVDELLQLVLGCEKGEYLTYQQAFIEHVGLDPLSADIDSLKSALKANNMADIAKIEQDRDILLQLLFSEVVESRIGLLRPCFVYHFPASQAALARLVATDKQVAARFEVYFKGIELANGFHELTCAQEQAERFEADNHKRLAAGRPAVTIDEHFMAALASGLPDCAGVALGMDRLVMLALGIDSLSGVMAFDIGRA